MIEADTVYMFVETGCYFIGWNNSACDSQGSVS